MASIKPYLLNIPVEVRRQILSYLTREVKSRWRWNYWPLSGNAGVATIQVHNIPSLNVMLSCTRLYEESLASNNIHRLSIVIDLSLDDGRNYTTESARDQKINEYILPRIVSATINIAARPGRQLHHHMWFNVGVLSKALAVRSSKLATIRVVARDTIPSLRAEGYQSKPFTGIEDPGSFPSSPPAVLAHLPLQRHPDRIQDQLKTITGHRLDEQATGCLFPSYVQHQEVTREWVYQVRRT